jgi:hypothetical protein
MLINIKSSSSEFIVGDEIDDVDDDDWKCSVTLNYYLILYNIIQLSYHIYMVLVYINWDINASIFEVGAVR